MFIEKLRSETKHIHQALEKVMIPDLKQASTLEDYARILKTFYGYFKALEVMLDEQLTDQIVPVYNQRRKSDFILEDLKSMNFLNALPPLADRTPEITNVYEALGAMYVLEGSTLGGRVITKMLMQNLNLSDTTYLKFFSGYGEQTDSMWASFMTVLNKYGEDESKHHLMLKAATDTFAYFKDWIEKKSIVN